jgi:hypothetical protein
MEKRMHFSYDLEATLSDEERIADKILAKYKAQDRLKDDNFNIVIHDYFTHFDRLRNSKLYKIFDAMPKGGLHHVHTTAAPAVDLYVKLTYNNFVYFNEREKIFKVAPVRNSHLHFIFRKDWTRTDILGALRCASSIRHPRHMIRNSGITFA